MWRLCNVTLAVLLVSSARAHAEFSLSNGSRDLARRSTGIDGVRPGDAASLAVGATPIPLPAPATALARGFGVTIPLDFAVRQIVPPDVSVRYASDVSRTALVSWKGGRPWPTVLLAAVRPLGLHIHATRRSVAILR